MLSADNTLRDLHNSSYDKKPHSLIVNYSLSYYNYSLNMLTSIDVTFIFDSVLLGLFSSANILQLADVALRVVFLLFLPCF